MSFVHKSTLVAALATALAAGTAQAAMFFGSVSDSDPSVITKEADAFARTHTAWAQPFMRALYRDGEWGAVLNFNRLGLAAMEQGEFGLARSAFDQAITRVESIYADEPNAIKARSVFNAEKIKDFKGEPYERAMMYFYRGLLYLQEGDFQNARAAFLSADRHDTLSSTEDAAYAGDFGMMKYLAGWASACDGDEVRAEHLFREAKEADPSLASLPARPGQAIVLVDTGPAPVKWGDGEYRQILKFKAGEGEDPKPMLRAPGGAPAGDFEVLGDVTFQATTRGGREVDGILAGKAKFKDGAGAVGDTALAVGTGLLAQAGISGDRSMANIGMAGMLLGMIAKGVEKAATPEADVRTWDTLPARVLIRSTADRGTASSQVDVGGRTLALPLQAQHGKCSLAWGRTRATTVAAEPAGPVPSAEFNRGERNRGFRTMLTTELKASQ
jgi:tetratricopeptide (TPR) repeat protein